MAPLTRLQQRNAAAVRSQLGIELRGGRNVPRSIPQRSRQPAASFSQDDSQDFPGLDNSYLERQRRRRYWLDYDLQQQLQDEQDSLQGPPGAAAADDLSLSPGDLLGDDLDNYLAPAIVGPGGIIQPLGINLQQGYDIVTAIVQPTYTEGNVPIINVRVDIGVTDPNLYPTDADTIKRMHTIALNSALALIAPQMPGIYIYGQTRLSADGNQLMAYDLTTPMVLVTELEEVFDQTLDEAVISNTNIGADVSDLRFRFTFVAPAGGINAALVTRTNQIFRSTASNTFQRRGSAVEANTRFIMLENWKNLHRGATQAEINAARRNISVRVHGQGLNRTDNRNRKKQESAETTRLQNLDDAAKINAALDAEYNRQPNPSSGSSGSRPSGGSSSGASGSGIPYNPSGYNANFNAMLRIGPVQLRAKSGKPPSIVYFNPDDATPAYKRGSGAAGKKRSRTAAQQKKYSGNRKKARAVKRQGFDAAGSSSSGLSIYGSFASSGSELPFQDTFGLYDSMKRKIFHHTALDEFFLHSKAVLEVPTTHKEGFCLAMAFIRSQARFYNLKSGDVREVLVSHQISDNDMTDPHCLLVTLPILPTYVVYLAGKEFPFLKYNEASQETEGVLFNPYRSRQTAAAPEHVPLARGGMKYQNVLEQDEIQAWYRLAQNFHEYVTCVIHESFPDIMLLDQNKEDTLQYYADVTQTVICVYRLELQGKRTRVFVPFNYPKDLRQQEGIRVVSLLINANHATAITNLRDFVQNKATANRTTLNGYCLCCEKISTANNETKQASKNHFLKCLATNQGELKSAHKSALRRHQVASYSAPQFVFNAKSRQYCCRTCNQDIECGIAGQLNHVCRVQFADIKFGDESELYVYDMECAQVLHESEGQSPCFIHEVNLVCVRRVYPDANGGTDRHAFATLESFMKYVLSLTDKNRIYLAHNGGRYDVQFVMQYIEANLIAHHFIPTPASIHAYLSVSIPFGAKLAATFLDFRNFMPGSLKGIGISFGLSVAKGDFPHRFNNGYNDEYEGALPPLDHEDDYWCLNTKRTEEDVAEFKSFYDEQCALFCTCDCVCTCSKIKWCFYGELLNYCWLDVDVLAEACAKYRNNALDFGVAKKTEEAADEKEWVSQGIDPFQYLTIPQLAVNLLLNGMPENTNLTITPMKTRRERNPLAIPWMEQMNKRISHIGNANREFFCFASKRYLDGIDETSHELYLCLDCQFHGCRRCFFTEFETGADHPTRPATYSRVHRDTEEFVGTLFKTYGTEMVHIVWSHELEKKNFSAYELQVGHIMKEREMFYGGRTEVFSPYINADFFPDDDIQYHDVCSLYPYVCAFKNLPTGNPEHICGHHIDRDRILNLCHPSPYFGYVRAHVVPHPKCLIGLLPYRCPNSGRLEFPLKPMTGSWGTEELRIAIENGYQLTEIYEVYHWSEEERSDKLLRGYVSYFLQMKQEAEGWAKMGASSETPSDEEQLEIQQRVFEQSGYIGKIRPECVQKNPVKRQMAKLFLNSLWGKFCQKPNKDHFVVIHGYQQFASLWYDPSVDKSKFSFRHISNQTWKVKFSSYDSYAKTNPKYNIFLASKVTEEARCILHRQMLKIGPERILYCDTDSLMFLWPKTAPRLEGVGLGNWVNEVRAFSSTTRHALRALTCLTLFICSTRKTTSNVFLRWHRNFISCNLTTANRY
jgi:hypothetical protein